MGKKQKPITPYRRLLDNRREWALQVQHPLRRTMWSYPKGKLGENWSMRSLADRVAAADQLGWDTALFVNPDGDLVVQYRKRPDEPPYEVVG